MACFNEIEFPRAYSPGLTGGPTFSTVKVVSQTGQEQRIRQWSKGRWKYDVSNLLRTKAQAEVLLAFFLAMGGSQCGFRFFDWADHSSKIADVETKHATLALTTTTFQLQKVYSQGGIDYARAIKKPISDTLGDTEATQADSTVRLYDDTDTEITTGWTVDCSTGIVTFDSAPGFVPTATFEFDVPCRFDVDALSLEQESPTQYHWQRVGLVELR